MNYIDPEPLDHAIAQTLARIDEISSDPEKLSPDKLERLSRAISLQIKAISDIEAHNERARKQAEEKTYLNYEDLPPPSPKDRDKLLQRIQLLYDRVNAAGKVPAVSGELAGPSGGASG